MDWTPLANAVETWSSTLDIALHVRVHGQGGWGYRDTVQVPAASTAKLAIMVETLRRVDRGEVALTDRFPVSDTYHASGSGVLRFLHGRLELTLGDLLYLMMAISDNVATNMLIDAAGFEHINRTMQQLGMDSSILGRPMVGRLALPGEQENLATAHDYVGLVDAIVSQRAACAQSCAFMLDLLSQQQDKRRIARAVPDLPGFRCGAKNGTNRGIVNEVGFIDSPRGVLLVAIYLQRVADEAVGEQAITQLTAEALRCAGLVEP